MFGKSVSSARIQKHYTKLKKTNRYSYWNELGSQAIQDVVQRVERSYQAFFNHVKKHGKKSPPKFRKRIKYSSFTLKQVGYKVEYGAIQIGDFKYRYHNSRPIEGEIKTVTIKRDRCGDFYVIFSCEVEVNEVYPRIGDSIGMDFGLIDFLTLSDGTKIKSPEWYKTSLSDIRKAHRRVSRCDKGSNHRKQAVVSLAKLNRRLSNQRRDWFFKLAHSLCSQYALISIEDLNIKAMQRLWGRKISDLAYSEFILILEYVAILYGTTIVKIDRWFASSKTCNVCGCVHEKMDLSVREWTCPECGTHHDRDINAAININKVGASTFGVDTVRQV